VQQYLIVGINGFGSGVVERVRALPLDENVVYHPLACGRDKPVASSYLEFRQRLLDVLNREVYNFANTPLTVYLVALLVEPHMAENLMHLGYLFKSFFRENIILNPRVKLVTALPTIIPEEAYEWLPHTRRALSRIDDYAALKEPFVPSYPGLKRALPPISGPPFEEVVFCYSESLDEDDVAVSAQAAATKIYFDLAVLPGRKEAEPRIGEFYRSFPAGQGYCPVSGCAVAFLPSLARLVRDEMEYALMMRLVDRFLPGEPPELAAVEKKVDEVLRKALAVRPQDLVDDVVGQALEKERWFDLASLDAMGRYDIEMSPSPEAYLTTFLQTLERERSRFAGRVRDLAFERVLGLPDRLLEAVRESFPRLNLWEIDALLTRAFFRVSQLLGQSGALAQQTRTDWEKARDEVAAKAGQLKEVAGARDAKMKKGSATEARIREVLRSVDTRALLRRGLAMTVAEALAQDKTLEARLKEGYDRLHDHFSSFLKRRGEVMSYFHNRRDAYLKRRELFLYVFNQIFRERILDAEIERALRKLKQAAPEESLDGLVGAFFFKRWSSEPGLGLPEVERSLMEAIGLTARPRIEELAAEMEVDYSKVLGILHEIAAGQVSSIFDMKYKEHPQAAYREAMFLCHRDAKLAPALAGRTTKGPDLVDLSLVPDLPFQVLQVTEIYNLPFRALRQYASLDRAEPPAGPAGA
jgi:hypothetical protein